MFERLFSRRRDARRIVEFYGAVVAQARREEFYRDFSVPDTIDGRFDMVALHVFLTMHRLKGEGPEAATWARRLYETMVADFDRSLREMGVGDSGIGRRVTAMVRGVDGRLQAYGAAIADADDRALEVALDNNLYGTVRDVDPAVLAAMAGYVRRQVGALAEQALTDILAGTIRFVPPPEPPAQRG